jgi:hypothetical protein
VTHSGIYTRTYMGMKCIGRLALDARTIITHTHIHRYTHRGKHTCSHTHTEVYTDTGTDTDTGIKHSGTRAHHEEGRLALSGRTHTHIQTQRRIHTQA